MTMKARIEIQGGRTAIVLSGAFSAAGWEEAYHAMLAAPGFKRGMPTLWDLRAVEDLQRVTRRELETILVAASARIDDRGSGHTAVVMDSDLGFGLGRMFEMMSEEDLPITMRVFRDRKEAETWLTSLPL